MNRKITGLLLWMLFSLAACGGRSPAPTEPAISTATPDPLAGFVLFEDTIQGLHLYYPADWTAEVERGGTYLVSDPAMIGEAPTSIQSGAMVVLFASSVAEMNEMVPYLVPNGAADNPQDVVRFFGQTMFGDTGEGALANPMQAVGEVGATTLGEYSAGQQAYVGTTKEGVAFGGDVYAVVVGERVVIVLTAVTAAAEPALAPQLATMLGSLVVVEGFTAVEELPAVRPTAITLP